MQWLATVFETEAKAIVVDQLCVNDELDDRVRVEGRRTVEDLLELASVVAARARNV